jgi:hypothetical protein
MVRPKSLMAVSLSAAMAASRSRPRGRVVGEWHVTGPGAVSKELELELEVPQIIVRGWASQKCSLA